MTVAFYGDERMMCLMNNQPMLPMLTRWNKRAARVFGVTLLITWIVFFVFGLFPFGLGDFAEMAMGSVCGLSLFFSWFTILISPGLPHRHRVGAQIACRFGLAGACVAMAWLLLWVGGGPERVGTKVGGKLGIGLQPFRDLQHCPAVLALATGTGEAALLPDEQWPASVMSWRDRPIYIWVSPSRPGSPALHIVFGRGSRYHGISVQRTRPQFPDDARADVVQWADDVWLFRTYGG